MEFANPTSDDAWMKQASFASLGYAGKKRLSRRDKFFGQDGGGGAVEPHASPDRACLPKQWSGGTATDSCAANAVHVFLAAVCWPG